MKFVKEKNDFSSVKESLHFVIEALNVSKMNKRILKRIEFTEEENKLLKKHTFIQSNK